jgi:hypothetical protein
MAAGCCSGELIWTPTWGRHDLGAFTPCSHPARVASVGGRFLVGVGICSRQSERREAERVVSLRDLEREQRFLADAARGHEPFVEHATARLDAGEPLFGDSWAWIGIRKHLVPDLSDVDRQRIDAVPQLAARRGAQAHEALSGALRVVAAGDGRSSGQCEGGA